MYHQKIDGYLYWSTTGYWKLYNEVMPPLRRYDPINPASGTLTDWTPGYYGVGELVFPGIDGPIASLRLANFRDGIEDYEYLWMLADKVGDIEVARDICKARPVGLNRTP